MYAQRASSAEFYDHPAKVTFVSYASEVSRVRYRRDANYGIN